jgi:hypothetical protein
VNPGAAGVRTVDMKQGQRIEILVPLSAYQLVFSNGRERINVRVVVTP